MEYKAVDTIRRVNSDLLHMAEPKIGDTWCDGFSPRVLILDILPNGNIVLVKSKAQMSLDGLVYDFDLNDAKEVDHLEIVRELSTEIGGRKYLYSLDTTLTRPITSVIFLISVWIENGKIYKKLDESELSQSVQYYLTTDWRFYVPSGIMERYNSFTIPEQVLIQEVAEYAKRLSNN